MNIYISLGSNINAEYHLCSAIRRIKQKYPDLLLSPVYRTEAVGFAGDDFLNCVALLHSDESPEQLFHWFRQIETEHGRDRHQPKFSSRTLDIDLLTYGNKRIKHELFQLPRDEITRYAFVLKPLVDIAAQEKHPLLGKSYLQIWQSSDLSAQKIHRMDLDCSSQ